MWLQPTLEKLAALRLSGMVTQLKEQIQNPRYAELSFEERLGLLVDVEWDMRQDRKLKRRLRTAKFREQAWLEDLDLSAARGLDRGLIRSLAQGEWIRETLNVTITGATGVGKTYLACALGRSACVKGYHVRYVRMPRLFQEAIEARADGTWLKVMDALARADLLILDDWLRDPLKAAQCREILDILDDRWQRGATMLVSQLPVSDWHVHMADATLADAILDRLVHNAYKIELRGESRRKLQAAQKLPSAVPPREDGGMG